MRKAGQFSSFPGMGRGLRIIGTLGLVTALCLGCKAQEEIQNVPTPKPAATSNVSTVILKQDFPEEEHSITVNGTGEYNAKPDFATVRLGVNGAGETAEEASLQCGERIAAIRATAIGLGIVPKDITAAGTKPEPVPGETGEITGYIATDTVTLTVKRVEGVPNILTKLTDAGAGSVDTVTYSITDASAAYKEALLAAMGDAAEKAQVIAQGANVTLKRVIGVKEQPYDETKIVGVAFESSSIAVVASVEVTYRIN